MGDTFEIELTEDVVTAVTRAKRSAEQGGSTFNGDRFAGMFSGRGIEGHYRVEGTTVMVTITRRPQMIPLSFIEMGFRSYFGADRPAATESGAEPEPEVTADPPPEAEPGDTPDDLREAARERVRNHALYASGAGLVPIPMADIAAVTAVQVNMLLELASLYGVRATRSMLREFTTALTGGAAARIGASALKAIPGIGTLLGGATMSITSGASTYAVGMVAIEELEDGRDIGSSTPERLKAAYRDAFEEGKELLRKVTGDGD